MDDRFQYENYESLKVIFCYKKALMKDESLYAHVGSTSSTQSRSTSDTSLLAAVLVGEIFMRSWLMMGLV